MKTRKIPPWPARVFGFESADDYGRANEATFPRLLRAQAARAARRARALAKRKGECVCESPRTCLLPSDDDSRAATAGAASVVGSVGFAAAAARFTAANSLARAAGFDARGLHRDAGRGAETASRCCCRESAARAMRLRQEAVSAAETAAAAQNEPLADDH